MKIHWSSCLTSVLGVLLLVLLLFFGGFWLLDSIFGNNASKGGVDSSYVALLFMILGLLIVLTLFFGGIYRMFKGKPPEPSDEGSELKDQE